MFKFIAVMFVGVFIGYLLKKISFLEHLPKSIGWTIFILIFLMGISIGGNQNIINNLSTLGVQAFVIAFLATSGSVLCAWAVYKYFFKSGEVK